MLAAPNPAAGQGKRLFRALVAVIAVMLGVQSPTSVRAGTPTLTTINIDGDMSDWLLVRSDPDNVILDGPAGGLIDADAPMDPALDIEEVAFTWDGTYLYFYLRRSATSSDIKYFWFFIDSDNDGFMESGEPVLRVRWKGNTRRTSTRDDTYLPANPGGDPSSLSGVHDGYLMPGTTNNGPAMDNINGGSSSGLEMEVRYAWSAMGALPGGTIDIHVSSTSTQNAFPAGVEDNLGRKNLLNIIELEPDLSGSTTPGTAAVFGHTVTNNGNVSDLVNLTWSSTGGFTPAGVIFYLDADGSGTLTPGDQLLSDTDGDGNPNTGSVAPNGGTARILASVAAPPGAAVGTTATVTLTAVSGTDPSVTDMAVDTLTLSGPTLTLVKAVSSPSVLPGGTITYTVTYTNTGSEAAQAVVVEDPVPAPAIYVAGSATGAGAVITFSHDGGLSFDGSEAAPVTHLRWTLASPLAPAGSGTATFSVLIP